MSDERVYQLAKVFFGLDCEGGDPALEDLNERCFRPLVQSLKRLCEALSPLFEAIARRWNSFVQTLEAAPEIPSYEALLIEKIGCGPLFARLMAHQVCHWGRNLADEINEGRKVRTIIDKIADAEGQSALVMSRRAKNFRDQCRSVEARASIEGAIKKANLTLTAVEFNNLVELACERDETACRGLGGISQQLAPHLPEKRGRPISAETCTHFFLLRLLESSGNKCAYTSSPDNAGFTDPVTRATQLASGNGGFNPLYAHKLHKENFLPPVPSLGVVRSRRRSS